MKMVSNVVVLIADGTEDGQGDKLLADNVDIARGSLPVSIGFDLSRQPVGWATLRREGDKFVADLELVEDEPLVWELTPAIGGRYLSKDSHDRIEIFNIALDDKNCDPRIPALKTYLRPPPPLEHKNPGRPG